MKFKTDQIGIKNKITFTFYLKASILIPCILIKEYPWTGSETSQNKKLSISTERRLEIMRKVIIDCDPGIDDTLALMLAIKSPEIEVVAITTV